MTASAPNPAATTTSRWTARATATVAPPDGAAASDSSTWTQRTVEAITQRLSSSSLKRRSFLTRSALIGAALAVDPIGFVFKPRTAWAAVCGEENECNEGWSAFCATINDGANTCPSGSYIAGWWKIDNTTFCSGRARYIVDCNRSPGSSCSCRCADGDCDRRRVCCNNFRYGQCNTQIRGTTEVVCRVVLCTPPWEWGNCTTTSLTSNGTRTHWSSRLPSRTAPTPIKVYWLEAGLTGSVFGDIVGSETSSPDGGAWAQFKGGVLTSTPNGKVRQVRGAHATAYVRLGGGNGALSRPLVNISPSAVRGPYINGSTYRGGDDAYGVWGPVDQQYRGVGDAQGWMGAPVRDMVTEGPYDIVATASNWHMVWSDTQNRATILRTIDELPGNGSWPRKVRMERWAGADKFATAARVSREAYPSGSSTVIVVRGDSIAEATVVGAVATRLGAPILFTNRSGMPAATRDEIKRLAPSKGIVVGDSDAIPSSVARDLRGLTGGTVVRRLAGGNRVETAADVSRYVFPSGDTSDVFLVNVDAFQDAIAVAPLVHERNGVVLLTGPDRLPKVVGEELRRLDPARVVLVGPRSGVGSPIVRDLRDNYGVHVSRIAGDNHHDTSAAVSEALGGSSGNMVVASTNNFADGLAATAWANPRRAPIILVNNGISSVVDDEILRRNPRRMVMVGPTSTISRDMSSQLGGYVVR